MRITGLQKDTLENVCLFKIQMDNRTVRGLGDNTNKCYRCKGYDLHCEDYTPVKSQRDLIKSMEVLR